MIDIETIIKNTFEEIRYDNPEMSLGEVLFAVYDRLHDINDKPYDIFRNLILKYNRIDEIE